MPDCLVATLEIKLIGASKIAAGFCRLLCHPGQGSTVSYVMSPPPPPALPPEFWEVTRRSWRQHKSTKMSFILGTDRWPPLLETHMVEDSKNSFCLSKALVWEGFHGLSWSVAGDQQPLLWWVQAP